MANRFYVLTSLFILLVLGYLTYQILKPFLIVIAWAVVFAIIFYPVYKFILKYVKSQPVSSILTVLLILLIIIGPFISLSFILIKELGDIAEGINKDTIVNLFDKVQSYIGIESAITPDMISENLKKFGKVLFDNLSRWTANITRVFIDFIFMAFAVFFILKGGPNFLARIRNYLPFSEDQKNRLGSQVKDMVVSTVYGGVVVAIVQGILGGLAFAVAGINSPVLWGTAMLIMSFLPVFGTSVIWGPAVIYLIIQGSYIKGIGLLLFGVLAIGMVDNILKPMIISGKTKMPTLLIFFSVIGGINFFGFIGFIMGPLVLALFVSVFEIFRNIEGGADA